MSFADRLKFIDLRSFILTALLLSTLSACGLYATYVVEENTSENSRRVTDRMHNEVIARAVALDLKSLFIDLRVLATRIQVSMFFKSKSSILREALEANYVSFSKISGAYDQIRLIDTDGFERLRVNYNNGTPVAVPLDQLQHKTNRYYVTEALKLAPGEVYVSPFDLNIEHGKIEQPLKPMIRVCMAIFDEQGNKLGVVVLNYLGQRILDTIRANSRHLMHTMLLNKDGYWLLCENKDREWGFMYEDRKDLTMGHIHPQAWSQIRAGTKGQVDTSDGTYTFTTVGVTPTPETPGHTHFREWKLVCFTPNAQIEAALTPIRQNYIAVFIGTLLIILFGALTRARLVKGRAVAQEKLREAKLEAEAANHAKSDFLARMSHEIRTPMNAVIGLAHLALKTELTSKQKDYLSKIDLSAKSLLALINDILDFSKIEARKMEISEVDFRLDDVFNDVVGILGLQAENKGLELLLMIESSVPNAMIGDPLRLGQVLINLTGNAIKFTQAGQVILSAETITEDETSVTIRFAVQDTGIGISEDKQRRLFQPFNQADGSITRQFGGTGLGLTISKRLVELMGGTMELTSTEGEGSTFSFALTFAMQPGQENSFSISPDSLRGMRVLIADSGKMSSAILANILKSFTFVVEVAKTGAEAIEMTVGQDSGEPYKLIITDWQLPDMDGIELARTIRKRRGLEAPPKIIMLTAYGHDELRVRAERERLDGFVLKPINRSILLDTIMNVMTDGVCHPEELCSQSTVETTTGIQLNANILLIEDNAINQQIACELLQGAGCEVTVASNGLEGVEKVRTQPFDAVFMDVQMPVMDGFQATKAIREMPEYRTLPIIAMTAHALVGDREKSLSAGMSDHITKPIDPELLIETLIKWIPQTGPLAQEEDRQTVSNDPNAVEIHGVNVQEGVNRVRGNFHLYEKLLRQFARQCGSTMTKLGPMLDKPEPDLRIKLVHDLKGAAGNVGAMKLQHMLGIIEHAWTEGNTPGPNETRACFDEAERVFQSIDETYPPLSINELEPRHISFDDIQRLCDPLEELHELMRKHDLKAKAAFASLEKQLRIAAPDTAESIAQSLNEFDFNRGCEAIQNLINLCTAKEEEYE